MNTEIAALKSRLKKVRSSPPKGETGRTRVDLLNELGMMLYRSRPLLTEAYAQESLVLSKRMGYRKGEADSNRLMGVSKGARGGYFESMQYFNTALAIYTELGNKRDLASTISNIGVIFSSQGRFDLAVDQYMQALSIFEEIDDKYRMAYSLNGIGVIFSKRNNLKKAEEYYMKALRIREETGDLSGLAMSYNNMGIITAAKGELENALDYHRKSLKLKEELGDKQGISSSYINIGNILLKQEKIEESLEYAKNSLSIVEELGDKSGISMNCNLIGHIMILQKRFDEALEYLERSLQIATRIGTRINESYSCRELSDLFEATGDYKKAYQYFKQYSSVAQEMFSVESADSITRLQVMFETEQKEKEAELYYLRNVELRREINERKLVESQLVAQEELLEERVRDRTSELQQSLAKLKKSVQGTIQTLSKIIESKDPYTSGHQLRVAELARLIACEMGFSEERLEAIYMISLVHDIGKISIPQEILSRPGKLSALEQEIVRTHPQIGFDILSNVEFPWPVADVILQHQELYDGSGYPYGLKGNDIMIEARIIAVADVIESMTSHRPYRSIPGIDKAIEVITRNSGILYDPEVAEVCVRIISDKGFSIKE